MNLCKSLSLGSRWTALYILLMSVVRAIDGSLNLSKMVCSVGYNVGPVERVSFRETELDAFALASNTTRSFVVVLLSLLTPCMGR